MKWTYFALVNAEELGVTSKNVEEMKTSNQSRRSSAFSAFRTTTARLPASAPASASTKPGLRTSIKAGRQLRRNLRAQRRQEHAAEDRPRQERPVEGRRPAIRAADPLSGPNRESGSGEPGLPFHSWPKTGEPAGRPDMGTGLGEQGHEPSRGWRKPGRILLERSARAARACSRSYWCCWSASSALRPRRQHRARTWRAATSRRDSSFLSAHVGLRRRRSRSSRIRAVPTMAAR